MPALSIIMVRERGMCWRHSIKWATVCDERQRARPVVAHMTIHNGRDYRRKTLH